MKKLILTIIAVLMLGGVGFTQEFDVVGVPPVATEAVEESSMVTSGIEESQ